MNALLLTLTRADEDLLRVVIRRRRPALDRVMRGVTRLGSAWVVMPLAAALASGWLGSAALVGRIALIALVGSHLVVQLLKRSICRERPSLPVGHDWLSEPEDRFSFPSGHAAAGISVALPLAWILPAPLAGALLLIGALVGVSRCYLGVHYPGDVIMGWALGGLGVVVATALLA